MLGGWSLLDRYLLRQTIGTLLAMVGIIMSLMVLDQLPGFVETTRVSGQRGYIVWNFTLSMLPEYGGIGLIVGLYFAIALSVRRLTLRGEIEAMEACGVSPLRWMRMPIILTVLGSAFVLLNQGWLLPAGEKRLNQLYTQMNNGEFGYSLESGQFLDLGDGNTLYFQTVSDNGRELGNVFLRSHERTFNARRGRISFATDGDALVVLENGAAVDHSGGEVLDFSELDFVLVDAGQRLDEISEPDYPLRLVPLDQLVFSADAQERSVAYGRLLWVLLAMMVPVVAYVLGKPPKKQAGAFGLVFGLVLLIGGFRFIGVLSDNAFRHPGLVALGIGLSWLLVAAWLVRLDRQLGNGFFDRLVEKLFAKLPVRLLRRLGHKAGAVAHAG